MNSFQIRFRILLFTNSLEILIGNICAKNLMLWIELVHMKSFKNDEK